MKRYAALFLSLLMLAAVVPAAFAQGAEPQSTAAAETAETPNLFTRIETVDIYGQPFDASQLAGKPLMINIWADWCPPCRAELPALSKLSEEYRDRMVFLGLLPDAVKVEDSKVVHIEDKMKAAQEIYEAQKIAYTSLMPDALLLALVNQIGLKAFPTTLFVDGDGQLVHLVEGAMAEEDWARTIDAVLDAIEQTDNADAG